MVCIETLSWRLYFVHRIPCVLLYRQIFSQLFDFANYIVSLQYQQYFSIWERKVSLISLIVCHIDLRQNILWINSVFSVILAVIWADSCGKSTSRRLQAKAVPTESVHKKTANKVVDFVDSLSLYINISALTYDFIHWWYFSYMLNNAICYLIYHWNMQYF